MPPGVEGYATRIVDRMVAQAACYGQSTGIYARRLLDGDAPWMMMRSVYRLIGLAKRYGPERLRRPARGPWTSTSSTSPRSSRCWRTPPRRPRRRAAGRGGRSGRGRFARDPAEYATATGVRLQVARRRQRPRRQPAGPDRSRQLPAAAGTRAARRGGGTRLIISSPALLFIPFLLPCGKEKERPSVMTGLIPTR